MKKYLFILAILLVSLTSYAQSIRGNFPLLANQLIRLEGFRGLKTYPISTATFDGNGNFKLSYAEEDCGVAYLISSDEKPLFVLLSGEEVEISGEALSAVETIHIKKGKENLLFEQYAKEHPRREQALSAWIYLEKIYSLDPLFSIQKTPIGNIQAEKKRIKEEDASFLSNLPTGSYVSWFLPTRKLVSDVSTIAQYRTEEIPSNITAFRKLDYTDERLYRSGLLKDAIESHFWLLENSGKPLDSVFIEMKISIDSMFLYLIKNEERLNEVTDYLFDLLERHSLFQASEYLALKALNETSCTLNADLAKQLESYRAMKKGNIAPDMEFKVNLKTSIPKLKKISDLKSPYTLVVFGATWCETCKEEVPKIANLYSKWKGKGVEVVFVSLDETKEAFEQFVQPFPFPSYCDYGKWNSPIATAYYVFGTPTMFLLDAKREILLRPNSINQMDAWVDWYLKE